MSKHTPGPWVAQIDKHIKRGRKPLPRMALVMVGGGQAIDCTYSGVDFEESAANARLIAAAPEMLEALKAALGFLEDEGVLGDLPDEMRAAIAKAEGRTP